MSGPVPSRAGGAAEAALLGLVGGAVDAGWTLGRVCGALGIDRSRVRRWQQRRAGGRLDDARPGGNPVHGILEREEAEVLALFEEWGDTDRSHRRLAHRGSCEQRVWVSPSTADRALARHGLAPKGEPRPAPGPKAPRPDWCEWRPNQLWCWDASQLGRCTTARRAYAIVDAVSPKWAAAHLAPSPDTVAARILFTRALQNEGPLTDDPADRLADPDAELPDGQDAPLLLATSDNGSETRANHTRRFTTLCPIAQHPGRPPTTTRQ